MPHLPIRVIVTVLLFTLATTAFASTTWYVNGVNGSDSNNCKSPATACKTIGHAISLAASGDSVIVAAATYAENLSIGFNLTILGSNAQTTIIEGGGNNTVVTIPNSAARVGLANLTIQNGLSSQGGGIYNAGVLTVSQAAISGNRASSYGGGIYNTGMLTIFDSTISGNLVNGVVGAGGGIANAGTLNVVNSMIAGNRVLGVGGLNLLAGGGIYNAFKLTISSTTFAGNSVHICVHGWGCIPPGRGWDIYGGATIQNSIVASSGRGYNCSGNLMSNGYKLSNDGSCNFHNSGDRNNTDPLLGTLGNYGGPTQTIPLLSGSPAIDAGNPSGCNDNHGLLLPTDQRGFRRHDLEDSGGCDMGAYERQMD
jgi:hypothetical protein